MTDTQHIFEQEGTRQDIGANQPFLVRAAGSAWLVRSGVVDVFSVDVADGEPAGSRSYLFRVEAGEIVLGMGQEDGPVGLLAVAGIGASLVALPQPRLKELARDPAHAETVAAWIETWAGGLLSAVVRDSLPPKEYQELVCGKDLEVEDGQSAGVRSGFAWVRHAEGHSRLIGRSNLPLIAGERFFPLCPRTWLVASGKALLRAADTETVLKADAAWADVDAFHRHMLEAIAIERKRGRERDRERMEAAEQVDQAALESAYTHLGSVFVPEVEHYAETPDDHLLDACQRVGKAMGLEIRPCPQPKRGTKQTDSLASIAKASRIRTRRVLLEHQWWRKDAGPMLGYLAEGRRPVALLPTKPGKYVLWDPAERTGKVVDAAVAATLDSCAYVFYRTFPDRPISAGDLLRFGLSGLGKDVRRVVRMGVAIGLLALVAPIVTNLLFDAIIPSANLDQLVTVVIALGVSALAVAMFRIVRALAMLRIETVANGTLEAAVWDRLLNLPLPFFRRYTAGDLALRATGISMIREMLSDVAVSSVLDSVFSLFSILLLFCYSWTLALVALGILLLGVLASAGCTYLQFCYQKPLFDIQGKIQGLVLQFIAGMSKLRVSGAENRALSSWARMFAQQKRLAYKSRTLTAGFSVFTGVLPVVSSMAIYGWFAFFRGSASSQLTTGQFLAFTTAFAAVLTGGISMATSLIPVLMVAPLLMRMRPILQTMPEVNVNQAPPGELSGHIEVNHVSFRYAEDGPLVLKDISLRVRPGEFVAIVGPSGSGKSTLFRLLLGFEFAETGSLYYDDQDLAGLDIQALRSQIGVVLQNSKVLPGTIFENIAGASLLTMDEAWEAARMCGLAEDIEQMPMRMHTMIAEGGAGLSGGQRQRILIARAIARRPRILLFDEATSSLDNETQAIASRSLERLKATRIVIAHRLSTIVNADRIFVLVNGSIVQSGTYDELMEEKGVFADLAKRQII